MAAQSRGSLYTTSVNEAELFYGISAMPEGRRRSGLAAGAEALFAEEFAGRVLVFGGAAARRYAEIVILRRRAGKPIEAFDALHTFADDREVFCFCHSSLAGFVV